MDVSKATDKTFRLLQAKAKALCDWKLATLLLTEDRFVSELRDADISKPVATKAYDKIPKAKGTLIRSSTDFVTYILQATLVLQAVVRPTFVCHFLLALSPSRPLRCLTPPLHSPSHPHPTPPFSR